MNNNKLTPQDHQTQPPNKGRRQSKGNTIGYNSKQAKETGLNRAFIVYQIRIGSKGNTTFKEIAQILGISRIAAQKAFSRACHLADRQPKYETFLNHLINAYRIGRE